MPFTPVEIMALILILIGIVKIALLLIKPKIWKNLVKAAYISPIIAAVIALILAAICLNYLMTELTITQIFAVMLFTTLLMIIGTTAYAKELVSMEIKVLKDKKLLLKKAWFYLLIWLILIAWAIYELYPKFLLLKPAA